MNIEMSTLVVMSLRGWPYLLGEALGIAAAILAIFGNLKGSGAAADTAEGMDATGRGTLFLGIVGGLIPAILLISVLLHLMQLVNLD